MSFWGEPAVYAGPYGRPAQPGIFDRVMQGVSAVNSIAGVVKNFMDMPADYKRKQLSSIADQIGMSQKVSGDQPISMEQYGPELEKLGVTVPKNTDASRATAAIGSIPDIAGKGVTSPNEPAQQQRMVAQGQTIASTAGTYAPMPAARPKTLEEYALKNMTPADAKTYWLAKNQKNIPQFGVYDPVKGTMTSTGNMRPTVVKPFETPEQKWTTKEKEIRLKHDLSENASPKTIDAAILKARAAGDNTGVQELVDMKQKIGKGKQLPGNMGALLGLHERLFPGQEPTEDSLLSLQEKFQRTMAKTKNPVEIATGLLKNDISYNSSRTPPEQKKKMLADMTEHVSGLMGQYGGKAGGGKKGGSQYQPAELQSAYDQKAQEIAKMPDGPNKQTATQQLEAWKTKHLGE